MKSRSSIPFENRLKIYSFLVEQISESETQYLLWKLFTLAEAPSLELGQMLFGFAADSVNSVIL